MAIKGNLAEFSLPEIFRFLAQRQGTGLLSIHVSAEATVPHSDTCYVWLNQGCIVAVAERLDGKGLLSLISQRGWVKHQEICEVLKLNPCAVFTPTGLLLKDKGALHSEHLKLLFIVQVVQRVCGLFKLQKGKFVFDTMAACPWEEMTGLSLPATEATLLGLRVLRNWAWLVDKLPEPNLALAKTVSGKPYLKLDSQEWRVWEMVNGKLSPQLISNSISLPLETVQQIAFRLNMVGLIEEVPRMVASDPLPQTPEAATLVISSKPQSFRASLPRNLKSLFSSKASFSSCA